MDDTILLLSSPEGTVLLSCCLVRHYTSPENTIGKLFSREKTIPVFST